MALQTKFDELLEFPCTFTFKVIGVSDPKLLSEVIAVIQQHAPCEQAQSVKKSSKGNYQALSIPVSVTCAKQIEAIYTAVNELELVRHIL